MLPYYGILEEIFQKILQTHLFIYLHSFNHDKLKSKNIYHGKGELGSKLSTPSNINVGEG
jgi:hypothetical protein